MAVYPVYAARGVTKNATPVPGATHASFAIKSTSVVDPGGAGATGPAGAFVASWDISVTVFGNNIAALLALLGSTKESVIVKYVTTAGALRKVTFLNVQVVEVVGQADIPRGDDGAPIARLGVRGYVAWAVGTTLAAAMVDAPDS